MPPQLSLPSILLDLIGILDTCVCPMLTVRVTIIPLATTIVTEYPVPIILALLGKKLLALGI